MKKFINEKADINNPKWNNLIHREKEIYKRENDLRSDFERDYNRILHSNAYKRMKHKTQVFFSPTSDHICTRMEHVSHVDSISYTISNTLGLNTELTKAISIGHDLGHAPFGHQGERILSEISKKYIGDSFWHEKNGVNIVDNIELLEDCNSNFENMNLTYAVRDGIISHCGEIDENCIKPRNGYIDLNNYTYPNQYSPYTWEGCVVKISDKISYLGRDIEDAITLGIVDRNEIPEFPRKILGDNNRQIVDTLIKDVIVNSFDKPYLSFSQEVFEALMELQNWNFEKIYNSEKANANYDKIEKCFTRLYYFYLEKLSEVNPKKEITKNTITASERTLYHFVNKMMEKPDENIKRIVVDYIAGQTDKFFLNECELYLE